MIIGASCGKLIFLMISLLALAGCGANGKSTVAETVPVAVGETESDVVSFDADSAYAYIARQVSFGPRVPNTEAHRRAGDWLAAELRRHGAEVIEQKTDLIAFDGTVINARNIFGQFNPDAGERLLLLAHWDCRPWADQDPDPKKHTEPVDGANDGASGVGVLLELARQISLNGTDKGIDILFVDAEDWGEEGDDSSWALGTQYFASNPPVEGYYPSGAILLDMVGGYNATFYKEYFSERYASQLNDRIWQSAARLGYGERFPNNLGTAVMDDHVELIRAGIPAVDIIEYNPGAGFNPRWHTVSDNMEGISKETLSAVGKTLSHLVFN